MRELQPGTLFGRDFRVVRALRAGGMGAVYVVDQLSTGKQRALKVMAPELASDPQTRERFRQEAMAASKIDSDHVVEIVTAGVDEETQAPYLVMELLKGEELADAITRSGPLPLGDVAEILAQIGHALELAHAQGIVHRDLKPENVFLVSGRRRGAAFTAKLLDFGIAKLVDDSRQKTGTQPLGTPLFMAPEQTDRKGRICPATDVWALGLIAFRLLTGKDFWVEVDGSLPQLLREIVVEPIPFATERARALGVHALLPPGFDAWFARCVNRDLDARFQEAGEAVRAFGEIAGTEAPRGGLHVETAPHGITQGMAPLEHAATVAQTGGITAPVATGSPMVSTRGADTPAPRKGRGLMWAALGTAFIGGGIGAFVFLGRTLKAPDVGAPSTSPPAPAAPPTGAVSAATAKTATSCPEGMIFIEGGKMFMGARDLTPDAKPPHEVAVSSFCLDKTEVTTRAYVACVDKGECERSPSGVSWPNITEAQKKRYGPLCNAEHKDRADHPINCVAWPMADNFCKKRGARLPTEAEWEYAARGSSQRTYPWGEDAPNGKLLNACGPECVKWGATNGDPKQTMYADDDGFPGTAPVGSFPAGASKHGILDLAGNVWEWTADWYGPYASDAQVDPKGASDGTQRVVRGGDFFSSNAEWARPAYRWKTDPDTYNHAIGFRCAAAP